MVVLRSRCNPFHFFQTCIQCLPFLNNIDGYDAWADKATDFCQVGDRVLVGKYTGMFSTSPVDGKRYRFINDLDIITPLKKAE